MWGKIDAIPGWLTEPEARRLYELALVMKPARAIELGAFLGRSTAALAFAARDRNLAASVVGSVDLWAGGAPSEVDAMDLHIENLSLAGLNPWVFRVRDDTAQAAIGRSAPIGLLFIDADHSYEAARKDFEAWSPRVAPGGFVAFHDSWAPGPSQVIRELPGWYKQLETSDSLAVFQKLGG